MSIDNVTINNLADLITLASTGTEYQGINNKMLYRVLPQIMDINDMIGMTKLKQTLFNQLIYYLQELYDNTDYLHTVIMGSPGCGKCLGKDVDVLMFDGRVKKSQDIQVGDVLMGDDSQGRQVTSVCSGFDELYMIGNKDDNFVVNSKHVLTLLRHPSDNDPIDICIDDITNTIDLYFTFKNKVYYEKETILTVDPYIMGYCLLNLMELEEENDEKYWVVEISDDSILEYFQSHADLIETTNIDFFYKINTEYFIDYPELFAESECLKVPSDIIFCKHSVLFSFMAGLIDFYKSQQSFTSYREFITLTLTNRELFAIIVRICNTTGITHQVIIDKVGFSTKMGSYTNNLYKIQIRYTELPSVSLKYFSSVVNSTHHNINLLQITKLDRGEYFGFEITGNGRFLLADSTVTHNTTIARLIGEMYKNLGILSPDGLFITAQREDLVAEYLGQTAIKTRKLLQECNGGVLFIDEVYALGPGKKDQDSFSKEAIDTLNVYLSEHKNTFCCIIAGYEDDIKNCFFAVNKGLERRFQWCHKIDRYTIDDLASIFLKLITDSEWDVDISFKDLVHLLSLHFSMFKFSGGDMEKLFSTTKLAHAKRIFGVKNCIKRLILRRDIEIGIEMFGENRLDITKDDVFNPMFI